jgi:amino acid transporter
MVNYSELNVGDPLAFVFHKLDLKWMSSIVAGAVIAMASVLLVFQMGQPRIWMSMSRDGLLPKRFSRIHPKYNSILRDRSYRFCSSYSSIVFKSDYGY